MLFFSEAALPLAAATGARAVAGAAAASGVSLSAIFGAAAVASARDTAECGDGRKCSTAPALELEPAVVCAYGGEAEAAMATEPCTARDRGRRARAHAKREDSIGGVLQSKIRRSKL